MSFTFDYTIDDDRCPCTGGWYQHILGYQRHNDTYILEPENTGIIWAYHLEQREGIRGEERGELRLHVSLGPLHLNLMVLLSFLIGS